MAVWSLAYCEPSSTAVTTTVIFQISFIKIGNKVVEIVLNTKL